MGSRELIEGLNDWEAFVDEDSAWRTRVDMPIVAGIVVPNSFVKRSAIVNGTANQNNTGDGVMSAVSAIEADENMGRHWVQLTSPTEFDVFSPELVHLGSGTVGAAYPGPGVGLTLTAGGTPFVAGDRFYVDIGVEAYTVADIGGGDAPFAYAGNGGERVGTDQMEALCAGIHDDAELNRHCLVWPVGATEAEKHTLINMLRDQRKIRVRA